MSEHLTIDDCMSPSPYTIAADESVSDAQVLMTEYQIRHLPVVEGEELVGILSLRDLHVMQCLKEVDLETLPVREVMSTDPYAVQIGTSLREVAINMNARKYGSTVVRDGNKVVGLFTTVDAMRVLANLVD